MASERASWQLSARTASASGKTLSSSQAAGSDGVRCWRPAARQETVCKAGFSGRGGSRALRCWGSPGQSFGGGAWFYRVGSYGMGVGAGGLFWFGTGRYHAYAEPLFPLKLAAKKRPKKGKRVMILMSDTGGGHRASAQALKAGFEKLYGKEYEVDIVDLWSDYTPWPHNQLPRSYSFLVHHPWLWRMTYMLTQPRWVHRNLARLTAWQIAPSIAKAYEEYDPDLVVSVHPLMQDVPLRVLNQRVRKGRQAPTPFATVVTDLTTCHNTWFHPAVTRCFVATDWAKRLGMAMGLKEEQVVVHGLPIRPEFSRSFVSKRSLRKRLGLDPSMPTVLLVGGGEGMGPVEKTVAALAKAQVPCQVVVVCGRNQKLHNRLSAREYPDCMRVSVQGFIDNMPDWMCACDAVITKAGPGTISEALICGLPLLINANVPCQEEGNIPYVVENGVGTCEKDPTRAALVVKRWFGPERGELQEMQRRARQLGRPDAVFRIVKDLRELVAQAERATPPAVAIAAA